MITSDKVSDIKTGNGYWVGELSSRHDKLDYLKSGALTGHFDGIDTLLDYVAKHMPEPQRGGSSAKGDSGRFNAFDSYEEAMETFRLKPEKVVEFDPTEISIRDDAEAGNDVEYDVTGDFIDMGRYMEGIPEVMGSMHNGNARNRRVNILVNLNQVARMGHEAITHRGERVLRLVDALEAGGVRTQLTGILSNECSHVEVKIKEHDEPLTISDLAVVLHPEFLRRIIFRINEHSKTWGYGYGRAVVFSYALTPELIDSDNVNEMNIVVDSNIESWDVDTLFDKLERLLSWEMSKPMPEVTSVKLDRNGIYFNPNGARSDDDIRREGQEAIDDR